MKKVILCNTTRNHLRLLIPLIRSLSERDVEVLLYCNSGEIANDTINHTVVDLLTNYKTFHALDLSNKDSMWEFAKDADSLLVTSGTSNQYHQFDYNLCKALPCKSFTIQHGISQEGITRLPKYHFSSDHVLTWVKDKYILPNVTTPREKFIPIGVPNHFYEPTEKDEGANVIFFTNGFDRPNGEDLKLTRSGTEWGGIYTENWKNDTWKDIENRFDNDEACYFVRHPTNNGGSLHPVLESILQKPNKHLVDNQWLHHRNINRSQLYSLGSKYFIIYPSSCFIDCALNSLDYEVFIDYNGNVPVLSDVKEVLAGLNVTEQIVDLLLED